VNLVVGDIGELQGFTVRNVTEGLESLGEVTVRVKDFHTARTHVGYGAHTDIVTASSEAYVDAINNLLHARQSVTLDAEVGRDKPPRVSATSVEAGVHA
jgi:2-isopropylmalate synthase